MRIAVLALLVLTEALNGQSRTSSAITRDDQFAAVRTFIQRQMTERQAPSIAVAVAKDGKIIWEEGFGWANREERIPATEHTMYSLASISKPITATGLMILKERGQLELDRPINEYLSDAKVKVRVGNSAEATVRRVANHTAGLPLHYQFFYADEPYRAPSRDETITRYANAVTAPGEKYQYSNLGFGILDYVIERRAGKSYAEFMRTEVFQPLGLTHMSVDTLPAANLAALRYGTDGLPIPFYGFDHPGGSAVYASAHDLVRFGMFHLKARLPDQKAILTDQTIDEMQKPTVVTGKDAGYGIGWATNVTAGNHLMVSHTGGMGGVATALRLFPAERIAIAVLSNSSSLAPHVVADEIMATLMPDSRPKPAAPAPQQEPVFNSEKVLGKWEGTLHTYNADIPFTLVVQPDGDVVARLGTQLRALVNVVDFKDDVLTGQFVGDVGTEDANRTRYILSLTLKLRGDALNGSVTAMSLPSRKLGNALTQWAELKRK